MKSELVYCYMWFVFQTKCKINDFFRLKDQMTSFIRSGVFYKFQCGGCNVTCYGKTKRHCKVRMCKHLGNLVLTGKRAASGDDSAIKEQLLFGSYSPYFSILTTNNNNFKVTLVESILINRDHPPLDNKQSAPLELFDR